MLIDFWLGLVQAVLLGVAGLLPVAPVLPFLPSLVTLMEHLGALNYFLPIAELVTVVAGVMLVFPFFMGTSLMLWILAQLRGSSSRG